MQRTLTSFVISGADVTRKFTHVENSTGLQISDKHVVLEGELNSLTGDVSCFSSDDNDLNIPHESDVMTESNQLMQPPHSMSNDVHGINNMDDVCPEKSRLTNLEKIMRAANTSEDRAVPLSCQKPLWVDDYICSVCGIEIPPSFTEDRL